MCTFWQDEQEEHEDRLDGSGSGRPSGSWRRLIWTLFVCKNSLLIVFGILGLITGSWVSLSELSKAELAADVV